MATVWPSLLQQTCSPVLLQAAPTRPAFPVLFSSWPFSFAALADRCRLVSQPEQQTLSSPMHGTSYNTESTPQRPYSLLTSAYPIHNARMIPPRQHRYAYKRDHSSLVHVVHWI